MALTTDKEDVFLDPCKESNNTRTANFLEPLSLNVLVPLSVIYFIIFVTGIVGNISTCIVIERNRSMHTATNFYLFTLAISDILLLIFGLPLEVYRLWNTSSYPFGESLCITLGFISETSANATVLTIAAVTIERYITICHPFKSHKMSKLSRVVRYIIGIWICALCAALLQVLQYGIVNYEMDEQLACVCTVKGKGGQQVFLFSSLIFFVLPTSVIIILYVLIGIKLYTSSVLHPVNNSSAESRERANVKSRYKPGDSQRRVVGMLVAVALSFILCWAPFHVQILIAIYGKNLEDPTDTYYEVYNVLTPLSGVLYFLSTAINPFLYNIMSNKFRNAFKVMLLLWCRCLGRSRMHRTYSSMLAARTGQATETSGNQSNISIVNEESATWFSKKRSARKLAILASPQSISNSSLREVDYEEIGKELATYLYQANCKIDEITMDTSV